MMPGRIAMGCAFPKVHVEDRSEEAKVAIELLDNIESLWRFGAVVADEVAESMNEVSRILETFVSIL